MGNRMLFEMNGTTYMTTKAAADLWGISSTTIASYCKKGRIKAEKDSNDKWCIPIDTMKPLTDKDIHKLLFLTIQLKNDPSLEIDWSVLDSNPHEIRKVYNALCDYKYIKAFDISDDNRIPYEVVLTKNGLNLALDFQKKQPTDFENTVEEWKSVIVPILEIFGKATLEVASIN